MKNQRPSDPDLLIEIVSNKIGKKNVDNESDITIPLL